MCLSAANRAVAGARSDHSERRENPSALYRYVSPCKTDCRYDKKARLGQPAPPPPPHCESGLPNYARGTNSIFFGDSYVKKGDRKPPMLPSGESVWRYGRARLEALAPRHRADR
eukprot:480525-Prorocentrum_minimum.AAC.1